jgi:hypothetical protein
LTLFQSIRNFQENLKHEQSQIEQIKRCSNQNKPKTMNWEKCRDFGLVVHESGSTLRLYYTPYNSEILLMQGWQPQFVSANWQGNSLIVKQMNQYGQLQVYIYSDFYSYHLVC